MVKKYCIQNRDCFVFHYLEIMFRNKKNYFINLTTVMSVAFWKYGSSILRFISFFSVDKERMKMDYPTNMPEEYHHQDKITFFVCRLSLVVTVIYCFLQCLIQCANIWRQLFKIS